MDDQVSMVWVLRNKRTGKMLTWNSDIAMLVSSPGAGSVCVWGNRGRAADFARVLNTSEVYETAFEPLDTVMESSASGVHVNLEMTPQDAEMLSSCAAEV